MLTMLRERGIQRGRGVSIFPLQQWRKERGAPASSDPTQTDPAGQEPRRQAQTPAFLISPRQPAELPGDEERDREQHDATECYNDGEQTH